MLRCEESGVRYTLLYVITVRYRVWLRVRCSRSAVTGARAQDRQIGLALVERAAQAPLEHSDLFRNTAQVLHLVLQLFEQRTSLKPRHRAGAILRERPHALLDGRQQAHEVRP